MKEKLKGIIKGKQFRQGSYSSVLIVIIIAIVVVINLAAGQIPSQYSQVDISDNQLYSIGDQTRTLLSDLDTDVDIYYICQEGSEDTTIQRMLNIYEDSSSHINVTQVDPVVSPAFASQYTDEEVADNSIIVVCGETSQYIAYSDMYITEVDYTTYSYQTTGYDGEGLVTSAIAYVTSDDLPKMYILEGHNESEISSELQDRITKANIVTENLSLVTQESVPEDCDILLINAPQNDLSENEASYIIDYLDQGGKAIITSNYTTSDMPNFDSVLSHYGLSRTEGIVVEGNGSYYYPGYPIYLVPDLEAHTVTNDMINNSRLVLLPSAQGIEISEDLPDGVSVDTLLSTSDQAYSKVDVAGATTLEKEDGDIDGPFALGVAVTKTVDESSDDADEEESEADSQTQLVYVSTAGLLDDTMNGAVSDGNYDFFMNAISWMNGETTSVSIDSKSLTYDSLMVTAGSANMWGIVLIAVIPIAVLLLGAVVWIQRRKR